MRITKTPSHMTPCTEGLIFAFTTESDEPQNVEIDIVDCDTHRTVAHQRLYNIVSAEIDIAPYIDHFEALQPEHPNETRLIEAPAHHYKVVIDGCESEVITVFPNRTVPINGAWYSTMGERRRLSRGDTDEILLFGAQGAEFAVRIVNNENMLLKECSIATTEGAALLQIAASDFDNSTGIEVIAECRSREMCRIYYTITRRYPSDMRLSWLSSLGTIERYTFPVVRNISRTTSHRYAVDAKGLRHSTGCSVVQTMRLISDYERLAVTNALAEILQSPKVWIDTPIPIEVTAVATTSTLYEFARPNIIEVELSCEGGKESVL